METIVLPNSVRYVKNGDSSVQWWKTAKDYDQIHFGWSNIKDELLKNHEFEEIKRCIEEDYKTRKKKQGAGQDFNALCTVLKNPSKHIWITFQDGEMWWCTARDGVTINPDGQSSTSGHFWLTCDHPWSNRPLSGERSFAKSDLPGPVTRTAGFRATVCTPKASEAIRRIILGQKNQDVEYAGTVRTAYEKAIGNLIRQLAPQDFEQLIDHIMTRTGWERISVLGKELADVDLEVRNYAVNEIAFVQVKSSANQQVLDNYIGRFRRQRERYSRMIFAVHSPDKPLSAPKELPVQLWTGIDLAKLTVRLGLGEWLETKVA